MTNKIAFVETPKDITKLMVKLSTVQKDESSLDTGCGNGIFLETLKEEGYKNILGIEIDEELHKTCILKGFNKVILGDFLSHKFDQKFSLILGNPPYAHFNQLPKQISNNVKKIIGTSESDIYYAFIVKSINLLKEGGELIYIVPYHFFYNTHARIVREHILRNGKIELVIDLDEVHLFKGENPETIIFKFKKGFFNLSGEKMKILKIKNKKITSSEIMVTAQETLNKKTSNEIWDYKEINHFTNFTIWSSYYSNSLDIQLFPPVLLGQIAKVGVSPVSGFDKAFLISEEEFLKLNENEKTLVKKFIKANNCIRFITQGYYYYLLIEDNIEESILRIEYPNVYSNLLKFKDVLVKRYLPENKKWFHWQALRNYNFLISNLNKKRIYVPVLDRKPYNRFSMKEENILPSSDVIFIQPHKDEDIWFLLGFLNSHFF
jgi:adenine-specific DNA-methyltransferase